MASNSNQLSTWLWKAITLLAVAATIKAQQVVPTACIPGTAEDGSGQDCGDFSECISERCECNDNYFTPSGTHTDCQEANGPDTRCQTYDMECVYCGTFFEGPCRKCENVIFNGVCYNECPPSTELEVSHMSNISLSIRICMGDTFELPNWAIIVIAVLGGVVLFIMAVLITSITCSFLRQSTAGQFDVADRNVQQPSPQNSDQPSEVKIQPSKEVDAADNQVDAYFEGQYNPDFADEKQDEEEFMRKLALLRGHAEVFLKMLNDMRRRLKEIPQSTLQAQQYRNVMQDLTRLLYLLNKNPSKVQVPPDGAQLLDWSQGILERYLQTQGRTLQTSPQQSPTRLSVIGDQVETNF